MNLITLLIVLILVIALIGAIPTWPHSVAWGPWPSSGLAVVLVIVLILIVLGRL